MTLLEELKKDVRFIEGLKACVNCGICTAICPAAAVSDYDPRQMMDTVQQGNETKIEQLLKGDAIWYCGECLSCKTRCPRGNTPGYVIQALRSLSVTKGFFIESKQGQKQLAIKRTVGEHILKYGYCIYIDEVSTAMYPEQGPIWDWLKKNRTEVLKRLGASYQQDRSGTLRNIPKYSLEDLQRIFDATGATQRFENMEKISAVKAREKGMDREAYFDYLYNDHAEK